MANNKDSKIYSITICLLIIISIVTIIITKCNKMYKEKILKEIKDNTVIVKDGKVKDKNEGKLVLVSGKLDYDNEELYDNLFYVHLKTPKLLRLVEMYQWYEYKEKTKDGKIVYKYDKKWSNELIDSSKFKKSGHDNPKYKITGTLFRYPKKLKIGDFELSKKQKEKIKYNNKIELTNDIPLYGSFKIYDNYITDSANPKKPKIGDNRVSYYYSDWESATILAKQSNNSFEKYVTNSKINVNYIKKGKLTLDKLMKKEKIIK